MADSGTVYASENSPKLQKNLAKGVDSYPIMRHRVNGNRVKTLGAVIGDKNP